MMSVWERGPPSSQKQASGATVRPITPRPSGAAESSDASAQQVCASYSRCVRRANPSLLGSQLNQARMVADATSSAPWSKSRLEETSMHAHTHLRFLLIALAFALLSAGIVLSP